MRAQVLAVVILLGTASSGCLGGLLEGGPENLEDVMRALAQALIDQDVDRLVDHHADDWTDLGGGDGTPYTKADYRQALTEYFASDAYARDFEDVATPDDLLDFAQFRTWTHAEARANPDIGEWADRYDHEDDDRAVHVPPAEGSPWFDGWFGFFRPVGGTWVEVAGD